jgi:hypothetical protein
MIIGKRTSGEAPTTEETVAFWTKKIDSHSSAKNISELRALRSSASHLKLCRFEGAVDMAVKAEKLLAERVEAVKARYAAEGWDFNF